MSCEGLILPPVETEFDSSTRGDVKHRTPAPPKGLSHSASDIATVINSAVTKALLLAVGLSLLLGCTSVSHGSWEEFVRYDAPPPKPSLHYAAHGNGRPVILLHGLGTTRYTWRHLMPAVPRGYRFFVFDLKGFGQSPKPHDDKYALYDQANLIYDFILERGLKDLTLIGHSMGGGIALLVALKLKEKNERRLSALILLDSVAYPQRVPFFITLLRTPILGPLAVSLLPADLQVRAILRLAYFDDAKIFEDAVDAYAAPLRMPGGAHALVTTARQLMPRDMDALTGRYGSIDVPMLLIWCREDRIVPLHVGERLHAAIPGSRLIVVDRCGHFPHEEKPEEVVPNIMQFLSEGPE